MNNLEFEICDNCPIDTFTQRMVKKAIGIKSGMRSIFISLETVNKINEFIKANNLKQDD